MSSWGSYMTKTRQTTKRPIEEHEYEPLTSPSGGGKSKRASTSKSKSTTASGPTTTTSSLSSSSSKKVKHEPTTTSSSAASGSQEKRPRRFRKSCPKNILERVERVWAQRFFCVDRNRTGPTSEQFSVLGSTGNVYNITIDSEPSCSCPDAQKGNQCKHLLFVMLKVLQVPRHSALWYQSGLLQSELEEIFLNARSAPQDEQTRRAQAAFRKATGSPTKAEEDEDTTAKKRLPEEGDACPVCYEDYTPGETKGLVFCESCGNGLHTVCFHSWSKQQNTCVMCRAPWVDTVAAARVGPSFSRDGYLNLGTQLNISPERDVSTYHQPWVNMTDGGLYPSNFRTSSSSRGSSSASQARRSTGHNWGRGNYLS